MKHLSNTQKNNTFSKAKNDFIKCRKFFDELALLLSDEYQVVASCNRDLSAYLIPKGTQKEITYYSKPACSLRVSDHWNWYSNIKKCSQEDYIQCHSVDLPDPLERNAPGKASDPIKVPQVCLIYPDGKYHCVFGKFYDNNSKKWKWMTADPLIVGTMAKSLLTRHKESLEGNNGIMLMKIERENEEKEITS